MARPKLYHPDQPLAIRWLLRLYEFLASLKLAVVLILALALLLMVATWVESVWGTPAVQFYIYHTRFFAALLALLAINIFCAAAIRYPWKRYQTGFVVTHLGLLTLLGGSAYSFRESINSQMLVFLDDSSRMAIDQDYGFLVFENLPGHVGPLTVPFRPGPFDWGTEPFVFGWELYGWRVMNPPEPFMAYEHEGTKVEVVDFYARSETRRLPFVDLLFTNPGIEARIPLQMRFLETKGGGDVVGFASEDFAGLGTVLFWRLAEGETFDNIRNCVPVTAVDGDGAVVVLQGGEPIQVSVAELRTLADRGETYELDGGYRLKLVDYRASRTVAPDEEVYQNYAWKFLKASNAGLISYGPHVRLSLISPDGEASDEFTRFADDPFYTGGGLPRDMRIEFYHPEVKGRIDLVEGPDEQILCRVWQQKIARVVSVDELSVGDTVDTWSTGGGDRIWKLTLMRYWPRVDAKEDLQSFPVDILSADRSGRETRQLEINSWVGPIPLEFRKDDRGETKQVKVRISWQEDGQTKQDEFWLRQTLPPPWMDASSAVSHRTTIADNEVIATSYKVRENDVGFALKLVDFDLDVDPGTTMAANYTSHLVRIDIRDEDEIRKLRKQVEEAEGEKREEARQELKARSDAEFNRYLRMIEGVSETELEELCEKHEALSERVVTMNRPMDYPDWQGRNLRFFQENYLPPDSLANRSQLGSIFRVNFDPGRFWKYLGSLLIVLGAFIMFYMRAYFFKGIRKRTSSKTSAASDLVGVDVVSKEQSVPASAP